jgi:hypothetical protein
MNTVSPLEATWTVIAIVGFVVSAWAVYDDLLDFQAIRRAVKLELAIAWGPRWWVALGFLGSDALYSIAWLGFAVIGVLAMTLPPALSTQGEVTSEVVGWVLVGMEVVLALSQIWWRIVRGKTRELIMSVVVPRSVQNHEGGQP